LYLEWCREEQHGSETQAPQTTYWIICDDENAVGKLTIRHSLTPKLEKLGGHFGYEIRPSYRRKGIASVALALGLLKIRTLGVSDVVITCDEDNLGSIGVMEHNGGILIEKYSVPDWPKPVRKYRFSLE
jgi:predicted acetyltransferase